MKTQNSPLSLLEANSTCSRLPVERPIRLIARIALVFLALLASAAVSRAQSGVWTNDASSVWSQTTNWFNGVVADGSGNTADFTLANVNTNAVILDASHSLGTLLFGATGGTTTNKWRLNATNNSVLTLAGGTPTIVVSNGVTTNIVVVSAPIAGTAGLTLAGNGQLFLGGTNSYTGTTTVNGGILSLSNSLNLSQNMINSSNTEPIVYYSFDDVSDGHYVYNQGVGGHAYDGTLIGTASIVPSGTGRGNSLMTATTNKQAGYMYVGTAGPILNASGGSWTVAMWVKETQLGAILMYEGTGGWGGGDTILYCNSGGTEVIANSFHAGLVSNSHAWEEGTSNVLDGNWHFVVYSSSNGIHTNYVDGTVDPLLDNSFSGAVRGNQLWIGGGPMAVGDANAWGANGGMIDEFRMYNRALSQAEVTALMNTSSGPTELASALPDHATVNVASGAKLDMNGTTTLIDSLSGSGVVDNLSGGNGQVVLNVTSPVSYGAGVFSNTAGSVGIIQLGTSTLTLTGDQTYSGPTMVEDGTLNITGNLKPFNSAASTATMTVRKGTVVFSGTVITNYDYNIGTVSNFTGAFYQLSGGLREAQGGSGNAFQLGPHSYAYGYYYLAPGASNFCGEIGLAGEADSADSACGYGQADIYGTLTNNGWFTVTRGASPGQDNIPSIGVANIYPGSLVTYSGGGVQCNWAGSLANSELAVVNVLGGTVSMVGAGGAGANLSIDLNRGGSVGNLGSLNLNAGGSFQCGWVVSGVGRWLNFNGGTLLASENQTIMYSASAGSTGAAVYGGGGTVNNNGFNLTFGQAFIAPTNNGVSISSFTGGTGYMAPPIVRVVNNPSDTTGVGATAIAQFNPNTGVVTNVLMTCPGQSYTVTPTFVLIGGNPTTPATITGGLVANASGGMTFTGSGTTTLNGGYTYTGATVIAGGRLVLNSGIYSNIGPVSALGGTLTLNSTNLVASVAGNITSSNAVVNLTVTPSVTVPAGSMVFNGSNSLNIAYGTIFANPSVAAISASGSIAAPGTTNNITVTAFGLKPGTIHLIAHSVGGLSGSDFANFALSLPPGVVGSLVNNSGNLDLVITSAPNQLTWQGVNGNTWDLTTVNWTNDANGSPTLYQQYNNGGVTAGDGVTFDDTVSNDVVNFTPRPTNINLTANFTPFPVTVNSTLPYSIGGAGSIAGVGNIIKNGTGSVTLLTSNSFTGGVGINAGTVVITNDFSLGANSSVVTFGGGTLQINGSTTNATRPFSLPSTGLVNVATNIIARFGGVFSGTAGLTKGDFGTLTLAGANTYAGNTFVNNGTLVVDTGGSINIPSTAVYSSIGQQNSDYGTLLLKGTGAFTDRFDFNVGDIGNAAGTLNIQDTATLTAANIFIASANAASSGAVGIVNQSGGTVNQTNIAAGDFTIGGRNAATTAGVGIYNLSGGTVNAGSSVRLGGYGNGTVNQSGGTFNATNGMNLERLGGFGTYNLNGGSLVTLNVNTSSNLNPSTFNFNGGTVKAITNNTTFFQGLTTANIYNNGATIDDGGFGITITQPLLGVTSGSGVSTITLVDFGSGYISPPLVTVYDGNGYGSNATAIATIANGMVTGIVVTCPGSGFDPVYSAIGLNFTGGGPNTTAPDTYNATFVPNGTGGLTKKGSGTLTLTGVNTISGPITNAAGTLSLNSASAYAEAAVNGGTLSMTTASTFTGPATVTNGATLTIVQVGANTSSINNLTLVGGAAVPGATLGLGLTAANNSAVPLVNCGIFTVNGTNTISLAGAVKLGTNALVHYSSFTGSGTITNLTLPQGAVGYISNSLASSTVYAVITSTGPGLVWTGTNSVAGLTNLWDINSTTNWLVGSTPTSYQQPIVPGDAVTFNDSGSGTVVLNTNVGPSSMVISNNSKSYVFGGRGTIGGPGGLTKLGSGTAILSLTNSAYTGNTTISNGTLQMGSASAISPTANLVVGPSGTLELAGLSESVIGLSGSGVIDNNSATAQSALTLNTGSDMNWNGTIQDQGLGGGMSLTKSSNNTLFIGGTNNLNSTVNPAFQANSGVTIITNNGAVNCGTTEWWVGATAGSLATNIVDGGTLTVNNWLVVGRGFANANGTLIVNNGLVQKAGGNNIVVGSLGAIGTLVINGGQVLNNGDLWLGEGPTAQTVLYLNGGLVQADVVRENNNGGLPTASQYAYFNGGTIQATASSANFLQQINFEVMGGGLILDDNGYTLSIGGSTILLQGDGNNGGLFKKGSGTVYLDTPNQYTGITLVTNGTLAGIGSVAGSVLVAPAGNLGSGDAAGITPATPFTIGGNLTLQGNATLRINKNSSIKTQDEVTVSGNANYGGTLTINNTTSDSTPLAIGDTFQLFNITGSKSGNFTSVVGSGATYSFDPTSGILTVLSIGPGTFTNRTGITGFSLNGANVVITGTNGQSGDAYYLLESTNVGSPLSQWVPVATNVLGANGSYTFTGTNVVTPGGSQQFYILSNTNN